MSVRPRKIVYFLAPVAVLAVLFLAGPKVQVTEAYVPLAPDVDVQAWVAEKAAEFPDIIPLTEDRLILADSTGRTPWSVVYIHGFSGSAGMAYPFVDSLAARMNANAYVPRLAGHGRRADVLGDATQAEWLQDTANAIEIASRLGDRVLLVALSNGAPLGLWAAVQPELNEQIGAIVLLSPNIAPADPKSDMLLWPWGTQLARMILGERRQWDAYTEAHGLYSTNDYETRVLPQMMACVELLRQQDLDALKAPVLVMYSDQDEVISPEAITEFFGHIPTAKKLVEVGNVGDPNNHLIVGDALSPEETIPAVEEVLTFLNGLQTR
ncbi:MAG: alpha-beta hydrolase superfamily lysophospholipase [Rhodothermales bacterium]|jgi:alpha-beta hydrolase superfamily lysophospholipase